MTNELAHHYHLGESTSIFVDIGCGLNCLFSFSQSKQNSPRWDAAFCGVTSGAILFAYVPRKRRQTLKKKKKKKKKKNRLISVFTKPGVSLNIFLLKALFPMQ